MSVGRPRLLQDTMPGHIDPRRLPKRCYWDKRDRVWYTIHNETPPRRQRVAGAKATLAELHAIMESIAGIERGSLSYLLDQFHESGEFKQLAPSTQAQYDKQRHIAKTYRTKVGLLGDLIVSRMGVPMMQVLIDSIAERTPTKANHLLRYLRRSFAWGIRRGICKENPCRGVRQARERKQRNVPTLPAMMAVLRFFQERGAIRGRQTGAVAPYLWIAVELAYLCRLRGIEVVALSDASAVPGGVRTNRTKGSRDNIVEWTPRLRAAWDAAVALRERIWTDLRTPVPIQAADRPLLVNTKGQRIRRNSFDSAWQDAIKMAIRAGVIAPEQRFALHGMKHRGITDTPGTRSEKQVASGHKSAQMLDVYDHSVPVVKPAGE